MLSDIAPFRMAGNLYFVGCYKTSSHLIDTGDGLILIDVGYDYSAEQVLESISMLGFDAKNIRIILLSHGHNDHSGGVRRIADVSGAKIFMHEGDRHMIHDFEPDGYLHEGDVITLGNTSILVEHTPGHTAGTVSFFFDLTENGNTVRAGMFGGAGTKQLTKSYLDPRHIPYTMRGEFFRSIERLRGEHVDILVGNHSWHNHTRENAKILAETGENRFLDGTMWGALLDKVERDLWKVIRDESRELFTVYAHRGASEYAPQNTLLSFYMGVRLGANGIETDVQKTKDGQLVLFHDDKTDKLLGVPGRIADFTYEELTQFRVEKNGAWDRVPLFEDYLRLFGFRPLTFAIELKVDDIEEEVAALIRKYHMEAKVVVTSFTFSRVAKMREIAPELRTGFLTGTLPEDLAARMKALGIDEICPRASIVTPELVHAWHADGFRVRAWGVVTTDDMKRVYDSLCDGTTINFPDKLLAYIEESKKAETPAAQ